MDDRMRARIPQALALVGEGAITVGSVAAALLYTGTQGEPYSPLNHWVSELGQVSVSQGAWLFNLGLIVAGLCFVAFIVGLAAAVPGRLRFAWAAVGVIAGIGGALVGVFPMDQLAIHSVVALTFFFLSPVTVALASIDLWRLRDARFPRWHSVIGAVVVVIVVAFLFVTFTDPTTSTSNVLAAPETRPAFWLAPTLEWAVIVGVMAWTLLVALAWIRADRRAAAGVAAAGATAAG